MTVKIHFILIYDLSVDKIFAKLAHSTRSVDAVVGVRLSQRCLHVNYKLVLLLLDSTASI